MGPFLREGMGAFTVSSWEYVLILFVVMVSPLVSLARKKNNPDILTRHMHFPVINILCISLFLLTGKNQNVLLIKIHITSLNAAFN